MLQLMDDEQRRVGIPVTSDFEDALEALRSFSARKVALAAKWKPSVMEAVARYLADAGLECVGACGGDYDARDMAKINTLDSVDFGVSLGRQALTSCPSADALLLGGGTWLSIPISATLEREFDKPVVSNMTATFWNALRQFGQRPAPNLGCRLLASVGSTTLRPNDPMKQSRVTRVGAGPAAMAFPCCPDEGPFRARIPGRYPA